MSYDLFHQSKGGNPAKVESWSHFNNPIPKDVQPHGNRRRPGDVPLEVPAQVVDTIVAECHKRGFSQEDTAHVLAIARIESGFNPDAAAGETGASGIGQFIDKTGAAYGLKAGNRFDLNDNVKALVDHFEDNKNLARSKGTDVAWIYTYHHDGPVTNSGGLKLAQADVLPHARAYLNSALLKDFKSDGPGALDTGTRIDSESKRYGAQPDSEGNRPTGTQMSPLKRGLTPSKIHFDVDNFKAGFQSQLQRSFPGLPNNPQRGEVRSGVSGPGAGRVPLGQRGPEIDAPASRPHVIDLNSSETRANASAIPLSLALREHLIEKGFDAATVAKSQALADMIARLDSREAASSYLVVHKEGAEMAALVPKSEQVPGMHQGDSVLLAERLKPLSSRGLDVDAVATLRGLAPENTLKHTDLEVYQAAPASLYQAVQTPGATKHSAKDAQDLVQGLSAHEKLQAPQPEQKAAAAEKETQPSAEMSMGS